MYYKILSLKESGEWDATLESLPSNRRDVYFTPEYYSLYQNYGDGIAQCFVCKSGGEIALYPYLINPISILGYKLDKEYYDIQGAYGYNGIITSSENADFIAAFWEAFDGYCQENRIIAEFTRFHPLLNNQRLASPKMKTFFSRHTVMLDLSLDIDDIWKTQISAKNRNMIRKAEREGVTIVESDDYETFYRLYNGTMADLHAEDYYFFPKNYFDEYRFAFRDKSMLCFAILEGKVIAGSMFMFSDDYAHYHLSARNREYSRYAANNLILWYAIKKAKAIGCKWFHFGGGTTGDDDDPLLHFKRNFSKELGEFWFGKRIHNQSTFDIIVAQWRDRFPEAYEKNRIKLLGYRE